MHEPTEPTAPAEPEPQDIIDKIFPILGIPTMRELIADPARLALEVPDEELEAYARIAATVLSDLAPIAGNPDKNAEAFGRYLSPAYSWDPSAPTESPRTRTAICTSQPGTAVRR